MSFEIGETVGPYRVMEKLGQGGMASVFKAYHAALDRYVALKVMHRAFNADETFMARFQREARVVARLDHPSIVPIYDFAEHKGNSYLVMKYVEGETLKARLKRRSISAEEGMAVIKAVGSALGYAHEKGILHRDVKPSNVILGNDGQIYLTDFGLARIAEMGESTLSSDTMLGTPQYISPEQAMGKKDLDAGTDIYSFGVLIYELVVGDVPFKADTPFAIVHDHIFTPLPLPREKNPNVPVEVERILLKALAKEREDRYETVDDLVAAFLDTYRKDVPDDPSTSGVRYTNETIAFDREVGPISETVPGAAAEHPVEEKPKPKRTWLKILGIIFGLLMLCYCLLLIIGRIEEINQQQAVSETPVREVVVIDEEMPEKEVDQDQMDELLQKLEDDPENPNIHLEMTLIYIRRGMLDKAQQEMEIVFEMVGDDEEFFKNTTQRLMDHENYLLAYQLYLHYFETHPDNLPVWAKEGIQLSAYLGAGQDMAPQVILSTIDPNALPVFVSEHFYEVLELRHQIHIGNAEERQAAERRLTEMLGFPDDDGTIRLLHAELLLIQGDEELAQQILAELMGQEQIRDWVRMLADVILNEIIE